MIVVAGSLLPGSGRGVSAEAIARRAAAAGEATEIVGIVPGDAMGDAALLALARDGVTHRAVLRTAARDLEPADLELALRYLPDVGAVVLVDPGPSIVATAAAAAGWSGAGLLIVTNAAEAAVAGPQTAEPAAAADAGDAILLAAPERDPDGAFAGFVAAVAARLAGGAPPADAWRAATDALGVEPISGRDGEPGAASGAGSGAAGSVPGG